MITLLSTYLRQHASDAQHPVCGDHPSFLKLHNGDGLRNPKVSFVAFCDGLPCAFIKTARRVEDGWVIERAHAGLKRAAVLSTDVVWTSSLPRPLWLETGEYGVFCAETMLSGIPLPATPEAHQAVLSWLSLFGRVARNGTLRAEDVDAVYARVRTLVGCADVAVGAHLDETYASLMKQIDRSAFVLPRMPAHGDFTSSNVLYVPGQVGVIDWDRFGDIEIPLFDLFTYLDRLTPAGEDVRVRYAPEIMQALKELSISDVLLPLLFFFYRILTDWRKREFFVATEAATWDARLCATL